MTLTRPGTALPEGYFSQEALEDAREPAQSPVPVFADPRSRSLARLLERIAATNVPVLLTGETGTGKGCLARYIHDSSGRTGGFTTMHCGFLIGHSPVKVSEPDPDLSIGRWHLGGAPPGGDGGTAFFDDVEDLSPALQSELLRLLCETDGGSAVSTSSSRVRVIAATSIDLGEATARGRFRRDLLYRLNIAAVKVLPLRQRPADIVPLANHFLRFHSHSGRLPVRVLGQDAIVALQRYWWPGNVRELENVVRFALLTATRRELSAADLRLEEESVNLPAIPADISHEAAQSTRDRLASVLAQMAQHPGQHFYDDVEAVLVEQAYRATKGNQVHTATLLGISRNVVRTLLRKHGLLKPSRRATR